MALLRTLITLMRDSISMQQDIFSSLLKTEKYTHESMVRLKMIRPSDKAERAKAKE